MTHRPDRLGVMDEHELDSGSSTDASLGHLQDHGYLLIRRRIDSPMLAAVRDGVAGTLRRRNLTSGPEVCNGAPSLEWSGRPVPVLDRRELEATPAVRSLARSLATGTCAALTALARLLLGPAARTAGRVHVYCSFPGDSRFSSPPHQDTYGVGRRPCLRLWMPLTGVDALDGGLVVAAGSHRGGRLTPTPQADYAVRRPTDDGLPPSVPVALGWDVAERWVGAGFECGDVVVMHPDLVHASLPRTSSSIRLAIAVDVATGPLETAAELPWGRNGW